MVFIKGPVQSSVKLSVSFPLTLSVLAWAPMAVLCLFVRRIKMYSFIS